VLLLLLLMLAPSVATPAALAAAATFRKAGVQVPLLARRQAPVAASDLNCTAHCRVQGPGTPAREQQRTTCMPIE
jgi:hypothetical protein